MLILHLVLNSSFDNQLQDSLEDEFERMSDLKVIGVQSTGFIKAPFRPSDISKQQHPPILIIHQACIMQIPLLSAYC